MGRLPSRKRFGAGALVASAAIGLVSLQCLRPWDDLRSPPATALVVPPEDEDDDADFRSDPPLPPRGSVFITKVVGAAAQGAVAAAVAALLSAFTEPVVNRLLVHRCTVKEALNAVRVADCLRFFLTTFPTNMLKFPVFEVINLVLSYTSLTGPHRGVLNGWLFCTLMLPVTNYRFRKSMKLPVEPALLYQAYPPTVMRDIFYGWSRGLVGGLLVGLFPHTAHSFFGRAFLFGVTIWLACIISSPFNEIRGYWLQERSKALPFKQFFQPARYFRSTGVGSAIMGISLMVGMLLVPFAEGLFILIRSHRKITVVVVAAVYLAKRWKLGSKASPRQ